MLRRLSFLLSLFVCILSFLPIMAACLGSALFLSVNAEKEEQQEYHLLHSISLLLFENGGPLLYHEAAFIQQLENLINNFEYTFDLDGSQIFPNNDIKQ